MIDLIYQKQTRHSYNMQTIWTFGDSFTFGDGCREDKGIRDGDTNYYQKYNKEEYDIWPNLLSNMVGCNIKNMSKSGASNDYIIDSIIDVYDLINKNDIVIIQKTFFERFDVPFLNKTGWHTQYGESLYTLDLDLKKNKYDKNKVELETILNYGVSFASNKLFKERQDKRFNFLKDQLKYKVNNVFIWDIDDNIRTSINTISQHSNNEFIDYHFSFLGHIQFANILYKTIFEEKTLI
jgi:hypothetical protein